MQDYYQVLGIDKTATATEISKAYRHLAKKYHPDLNHNSGAAEKYQIVNEAYETLHNPEKRAQYDVKYQSNGFNPNFDDFGHFGDYQNTTNSTNYTDASKFGNFNFGDIFGDAFKKAAHTSIDGTDINYVLPVTFKQTLHGDIARISYDRQVECNACHGTGMNNDTFCTNCKGTGLVTRVNHVELDIPIGVKNNEVLTYANQGNTGRYGGKIGDLRVTFKVKKSKIYQRRDDKLFIDVPVSLTTALLGGTANVKLPNDQTETIMIPESCQFNQQIFVGNYGIDNGPLYAIIKIQVPKALTSTQKQLIKKLNL